MRRIKFETYEPDDMVYIARSDYRKLLAVARAAEEHVKDCHTVTGNDLQRSIDKLNTKVQP